LPKISPISADKSWDNFSVLYALAYKDSSPLRLYDFALTTYHGHIESRMLQIRIRKDSNGECRYDRSYTESIKYVKKPNRMLGFFMVS
jgi:hypothetical protein